MIDYHTEAIHDLSTNILSDRYINDHIGYASALGALQAHQASLNIFESSDREYAEAIKKLEELDND